jgi:hypothetical protein
MPNQVTISGFKEFGDKMNKLATQWPGLLDNIAGEAAGKWATLADLSAPIDQGYLHNAVSSTPVSAGVWEVTSPALYSPYMEWGTKTLVNVPSDLSSYASQFMGGGGQGANVKQMIYEWVLRKGLAKSAQWPIFISIMRKGVRPHPFFFQHRPVVEQQLMGDLKQLIESID